MCETSPSLSGAMRSMLFGYVSAIIEDSLRNPEYHSPMWDAESLVSKAEEDFQKQIHTGETDGVLPACLLIKCANRAMACGLPWEDIGKRIAAYIWRKLTERFRDAAAEIAEEAIRISMDKWDPLREVDWAAPGLAYARKTAHNLLCRMVKAGQVAVVNLDDDADPADDAPGPSEMAEECVDPVALGQVIDEWLDSKDTPEAVAFVLDYVYGVEHVICGWVASSTPRRSEAAYRTYWFRIRQHMDQELQAYLIHHRQRYVVRARRSRKGDPDATVTGPDSAKAGTHEAQSD